MRYRSKCAFLLGTVALTAANLLAAEPAGSPVVVAPAVVAPVATPCDVYLTPFAAIGNDSSLDWMGKAVEQNLLTDLARAKLHPQGAEKPTANMADAQAAAKSAGAKYLITGSYQVADQQVRFNAQLIDAGTGNVVGGISATGAVRDLFTMEDALSAQALQQLGQLPGLAIANNKPVAPVAAAPSVAPAVQPPVVVQIIQAPAAPVMATTRYQGSALEQYVNTNRNPSADYSQPPLDSQLNDNFASTPGNNYNVGFGIESGTINSGYGNYGLGGFGYGIGYYSLPPYGRYGYGTTGHPHRQTGDIFEQNQSK